MKALVRNSSGEVIKIHGTQTFQQVLDANPTQFTVLTFTPEEMVTLCPDGTFCRERTANSLGPVRQLGFAKIYDTSGTPVIRNATQLEIDDFEANIVTDEDDNFVDQVKEQLQNHPLQKRILKALARAVHDDLNELRTEAGLSTKLFSVFVQQVLDGVN